VQRVIKLKALSSYKEPEIDIKQPESRPEFTYVKQPELEPEFKTVKQPEPDPEPELKNRSLHSTTFRHLGKILDLINYGFDDVRSWVNHIKLL
jgi:hypothetical protein